MTENNSEIVEMFKEDELISVKQKAKSVNKCGKCSNMYTHTYTSKLKYCSIMSQKGTAYGNAKVKSRQDACDFFKPKTKEKR